MKNNNLAKRDSLSFREKLELFAWRAVFGIILLALLAVAGVVVVMFFLWFPVAIVKVIVAVAAVVFAAVVLTKKRRQRASFVKKLTKICDASKYDLKWHRRPSKTFSWRNGSPDVEITANGHRYEVCFITPKSRQAKIQFEQRDLIKMIVSLAFLGALGNAFNLQYRVTELSLSEIAEDDDAVKILLVNPDRCEVLCKGSEGTLVSAGDGGTYFGRMVYTGNGFLKALERGDIVPKKKNFNKIDF